jgi:hypothetical protein
MVDSDDSQDDKGSKKSGDEEEEKGPDSEKVHWLYGDLARRYDKTSASAKKYEDENPGKKYQWEPHHFVAVKSSIMIRFRDWISSGGEHDTIEEKIDKAEEIADDYDDTVWWCR